MIHFKAAAIASLLGTLLAATATSAKTPIIDLSIDLETSPVVNDNPGATAVIEKAKSDPAIRTALVLDHGRIVADYVRNGVDPDVPFQLWSATKSWTSLLVGLLVDSGALKLEETLGDVWPDESIWSGAEGIEFRKNVTILSLLTMSSGLIDLHKMSLDPADTDSGDGGEAGGGTFAGALSYPDIGEKDVFSYLSFSNILSYVIKERTGMSPRGYAAQHLFPALGIDDSDIDWWQNQDGMEY